jgi:SAM-dependent methyltransferase
VSQLCSICGEAKYRQRLRFSDTTVLWECPNCKVGRLHPWPSKEELAQAYPEDSYYAYSELTGSPQPVTLAERTRLQLRRLVYEAYLVSNGMSHWPKRWIARLFRGRFGGFPIWVHKGRFLDVGCGDGYFLSFLQRAGWVVSGVESSRLAALRAQAAGLNVVHGDFLKLDLPLDSFDVVRMWHVLEHLEDPGLGIKKASRLLRRNGELIIGVPNAQGLYARWLGPRWSGWDLPRHLFHFSPKGLRCLLERYGFAVERMEYRSVGTGLASLGSSLKNLLILRGAFWMADGILDWLRLGDSLEVHARKKEAS